MTRDRSTAPAEKALPWAKGWRPTWPGLPSLEEDQVFLVIAILIGTFAGLAVVWFRISIEWARVLLLGSSLYPGWPAGVLVPALSGIVVAVLMATVFPGIRTSGVAYTKAAVYVFDGQIPFSTVIGKFIGCTISIGGGHSLGPEDPSLQIGAGLASTLGRRLKLSRQRLRLLAPLGAAAGLAAAFNSPITAVLFVIEEVLGTWSGAVLGAVVLSAVSSAVVSQIFLGHDPLFRVPAYTLTDPSELLAYAALGVVGGGVGLVFTKTVLPLRARLISAPAWSRFLQPAAAGVLVGAIGLLFPEVLGAGYHAIDSAMHDEYGWQALAALAAAKIVATAMSFVSGTPGGMFAPTLFIGAMVGGAVGGALRFIAPDVVGATGPYALVGMGTLFAAILRAPLTSVFMIVEVSGNYSIVIPVLISNTIAYVIARRSSAGALFDAVAAQDGLVLPSMEHQREEPLWRVEDVMRPRAALALRAEQSLASAASLAEASPDQHVFVRLGVGRWAAVSRAQLMDAHDQNPQLPVGGLTELQPTPAVYPDQPLESALRAIGGRPALPVVHRADPHRLEGVLALDDVLRKYQLERPALG
jgi:chloride channel protein, CIC family